MARKRVLIQALNLSSNPRRGKLYLAESLGFLKAVWAKIGDGVLDYRFLFHRVF